MEEEEEERRKGQRGARGNPTSGLQSVPNRLTARESLSAAELALFHTGAILSSPGYRPPATATGVHRSGGDAGLFNVCVGEQTKCAFWFFVCLFVSVVSDDAVAADLLPTTSRHPHPSLARPPSHRREIQRRTFLECVSRDFPALLGISLYFFDPFSSAASPERYRGFVQRFVETILLIVVERLLLWVLR